jgi:hypothetical protein
MELVRLALLGLLWCRLDGALFVFMCVIWITTFWLESFKGREGLGLDENILGCGYVNRVHLVQDTESGELL